MSFVLRCAGDSVYVYDLALFRMSVFGPDGRYAGASNLRKWLANGMTPYDASCNPTGVIAFVNRTPEAVTLPPREGPMRPQIEILVVTRNDSVLSLGRFPATEMYFKGSEAGPRHLGRRTTVGVGTRVVYVGTGDTYEVSPFSLSGARLSSFREDRKPVPVRSAQIEAYVNEYVSNYRGRANTSALAEYFRDLVWPDNYPAYGRLLVDLTDNLWVQDYPVPGEKIRTWTVYTSTGNKLAVVALPAAFQLLEADKDFVFGIWRDDDGVQSVRQYSLAH
jgi:hypothetical protein